MRRTSITTERLVLRTPEPSDAVAVPSILDEVVVANMGWPPGVVEQYVVALGSRRPARQVLVVCDRDEGRPLGLVIRGSRAELWTIGLLFGPVGRGRGFGREALVGALPWVRAGGAPKAVLETAVANVAMRRTAEAAGFALIGTKPGRPLPDGSRTDAACYVREW